MMTTQQRETIAWHEAGHAVVALVSGLAMRYVAIRKDYGISVSSDVLGRLDRAGFLRARIIECFAGGEAVGHRWGRKAFYSKSDLRNANQAAWELAGGDRIEGCRLLRECRDQARDILAKPRVWSAVEALARLLMHRTLVRGPEIVAVMRAGMSSPICN
jgi:hypothetical protein